MTCKVGDWVAFYSDGRIVIGLVRYRAKDGTLGYWYLSTDAGYVREDSVLERRPAKE